MSSVPQPVDLSRLIPREEWAPSSDVVKSFRANRIPCAAGGGLAFSSYACRLRATRDLDLFVTPALKDRAIQAITSIGYADYYDEKPYDRSWIYRGILEGNILDIIWTAPNHRMLVDELWLIAGPEVEVHGDTVRLIPLEEFLWSKLYVLQRDRCDWPDILNVLYSRGREVEWDRLLDRLGPDAPLFGSVLSTYRWLAPERAAMLPSWLWERVGLGRNWPETTSEWSADRVHLLDTREWFGPKESID